MDAPPTTYAAKCYWPGITDRDLASATRRAQAQATAASQTGVAVEYLGTIFFPDDDLVLCLLAAPSRAEVARISERAGLPCERVMHSIWLANPHASTSRKDTLR